jgi:flavin-dependent dehydrogenase
VGEQISTTFPFTGEGIGKAMATGEMAAAAIAAEARGEPGALDACEESVEKELRPGYRGYESAQRWLSRASNHPARASAEDPPTDQHATRLRAAPSRVWPRARTGESGDQTEAWK